MADLFMTVDSDSETQNNHKSKAQKKGKASKSKKEDGDDQILLSHSVILQDDYAKTTGIKKHTSGAITGSNNLWNFTSTMNGDKANTGMDDLDFGNITTADEKAPFMQSMEERVELKMKHHVIQIPAEISNYVKTADKENVEGDE